MKDLKNINHLNFFFNYNMKLYLYFYFNLINSYFYIKFLFKSPILRFLFFF